MSTVSVNLSQDQADALARGESVTIEPVETPRQRAVREAAEKWKPGTVVESKGLGKATVVEADERRDASYGRLHFNGTAFWSTVCNEPLVMVRPEGGAVPRARKASELTIYAPKVEHFMAVHENGAVYRVEKIDGKVKRWKQHAKSAHSAAFVPLGQWSTAGYGNVFDIGCYTLVPVERA